MKRAITILAILALVAGTAMAGSSVGKRGPEPATLFAADVLTHNVGNCELSVTDKGAVGFDSSGIPHLGRGFRYPRNGANYIFYASFLAGTDTGYVVDKYYNTSGAPIADSHDWQFITQLDSIVPPRYLQQEFQGSYSDSGHPTPKGLVFTQYSLAAAAAPYNNFVFVRLIARNTGSSPINGLIGAFIADYDVSTNGGNDIGSADTLRRTVYQNGQNSRVGGVKLLEPSRGGGNTTLYDNTTYVYTQHDDTVRWKFMNNTLRFTDITTAQDMSLLVSTPTVDLAPGDSATYAVAFIGAANVANWQAGADTAQALYDRLFLTGVEMGEPLGLPGTFALGQARPNPASGSSLISFALERGGPASLKVYDLSGRLVSTLVNGSLPAGSHEVRFDGRGLPGGVYFYRLEAGNQSATRKLVLVR